MHHQTKKLSQVPMDFFDSSPIFKTEAGNLKDMFSKKSCSSLLVVHAAVIAFIFIGMSAALLG
jgi:hypothetical protein